MFYIKNHYQKQLLTLKNIGNSDPVLKLRDASLRYQIIVK